MGLEKLWIIFIFCLLACSIGFKKFVLFTILGTASIWGGMTVLASKLRRKDAMIIFPVSFVCMLAMGYLSSKDFSNPAMNWIGECVNLTGTSLFLTGVTILHRNGLESLEIR